MVLYMAEGADCGFGFRGMPPVETGENGTCADEILDRRPERAVGPSLAARNNTHRPSLGLDPLGDGGGIPQALPQA